MIINRGITPSYPLQWFEKHRWIKPVVTIPEMRAEAKIDDFFGIDLP